MQYRAQFEPDSERGGFVVTFPDFEWGVTQGDTREDAAEMAVDALLMVIAHYIETGRDLPVAGRHKGRKFHTVELPAMATAKAELYLAFRRAGITKSELARRVGIPKTNVDRLFDVSNNSRFDRIEAAFVAIGKRVAV